MLCESAVPNIVASQAAWCMLVGGPHQQPEALSPPMRSLPEAGRQTAPLPRRSGAARVITPMQKPSLTSYEVARPTSGPHLLPTVPDLPLN